MEQKLIEFVSNQLKLYCDRFPVLGRKVDTIYFGGGSPSCVSEGLLYEIIRLLARYFDLSSVKECSIEVNPGDVSLSKIKAWNEIGVNRVSVGVQSFNDRILSILGRNHGCKENFQALDVLSEVFDRLSVDLIFAVPGQEIEDWNRDLEIFYRRFSNRIDHISIYSLTIEKNTEFYLRYGDVDLSDVSRQMYEIADRNLAKMGFQWYEISNFARPGKECKHNLGYWTGAEYLGLGPSGWSFLNGIRFSMDWEGNIIEDRLNYGKASREKVVLCLRTREGVGEEDLLPDQLQVLSDLGKRMGWVKRYGDRFVLTLLGRLFADELATYLI